MRLVHQCIQWVILLVLVLTFQPPAVHGKSQNALLPDGICGNSQSMLEASQEGSAMVRQVLASGMTWGDKSLNEYINRLGQNLARSSGSQQVFAFYVVY